MTNIKHPLITLSGLLPKVQRQFTPGIQRLVDWAELQDRLYVGGVLAEGNVAMLRTARAACRTPSDWFHFAGRFFPAHQRKQEILCFLELASGIAPRVVMEIGTAQSGTNFLLGEVLTSAELILAVDLKVRNQPLLNAFSRPSLKRVCIEGSSYGVDTVARVREVLAGRSIDVLFIDGDHTYEGVKADFDAYLPLVSDGGLIAFHDIIDDHQTRYGRSSGGWAGEVPRFWREVRVNRNTCEFVEDQEQDGMGIGVIKLGT